MTGLANHKCATGAREAPAAFGVPSQTAQRDILATGSGLAYRIFISRPAGPPPSAAGYPVVYTLDGNAHFGTLAEAVGLRSRRTDVTGVVPAVVVGIGYPTDEPLDAERRTYDYTPPAAVLRLSPRPDGTPWPAVGGADAFLDFIADDLMPMIAAEFPVDPGRQVLFGHSFGGLFALHTLFTRPALFRRYIAASPSIWWNECFVLNEEQVFAAALHERPVNADLLVAVGGQEQVLIRAEAAGADREIRAAWKARNRMVDNARELAERLTPLASQGLRVSYAEFADEDHVSVIPAAISRAVSFALGTQS